MATTRKTQNQNVLVGKRATAFFIDVFLVNVIGGIVLSATKMEHPYIFSYVLYVLYEVGLLNITQGQTIGKMIVGIRVRDAKGEVASDGQHFVRTVIKWIPFVPPFIAFDLLRGKLPAHDHTAKTTVEIKKKAANKPIFGAEAIEGHHGKAVQEKTSQRAKTKKTPAITLKSSKKFKRGIAAFANRASRIGQSTGRGLVRAKWFILVACIAVFLLYWTQIRSSQIRKNCVSVAESAAITAFENDNDVYEHKKNSSTFRRADFEFFYQQCLRIKGLKM